MMVECLSLSTVPWCLFTARRRTRIPGQPARRTHGHPSIQEGGLQAPKGEDARATALFHRRRPSTDSLFLPSLSPHPAVAEGTGVSNGEINDQLQYTEGEGACASVCLNVCVFD